jgi:hypothetical protein
MFIPVIRSLLVESDAWFKTEVWIQAISLSHISIETAGGNNNEISLAAIDLLFAMLR